ncbi:P-loop NTPase fold protein [Cognatiyoonia sp. IB215182]|uniref:KAP family P-loop NTPase fold protein n=1 Tax=Cognatiyoonia sp. IB215182 TaxID=3097353 RepID=UPI002A152E5F|nr:P-loop NTPase fold protein [Cognatiyoonia sp. IB215182]MDX8355279.1 P-loop NTPase fold protein [Cognatiyoonia sp. IB215182]
MTDDERAEIWAGDALNRSVDADILRDFTIGHLRLLVNTGELRTYVVNLDASWGAGKSFFLSRFKEHLEAEGHVAVYVNAWENDHSEDPFMTVVDEIEAELMDRLQRSEMIEALIDKTKSFKKSTAKIIGSTALTGGKHLLARYIGKEAIEGLGEILGANDSSESDLELQSQWEDTLRKSIDTAVDAAGNELLEQFRKQKQVQRSFREQLTDLGKAVLEGKNVEPPIFILIDELDRCRPSYAIELLERVKHIFSLEDFVYVLGTDTKQLANAIKGVYGADFDGERYLRRFIDRTYRFQDTSKQKLIEFSFDRNGLTNGLFEVLPDFTPVQFLSKVLNETGTEARDIEKVIEIIGTFVAAWQFPHAKIDLVSLLPLVYQRHFDFLDADASIGELGAIRFQFQGRKKAGGTTEFEVNYLDMWDQIDRQSVDGFHRNEPRNTFEYWIQQKNHAEFRGLVESGVRSGRREPIRLQYSKLLDRVSSISSATTKVE